MWNSFYLYQHLVENSHFGSAKHGQIGASHSERGTPSRKGTGDEEAQFGKAVASQNKNFQLGAGIAPLMLRGSFLLAALFLLGAKPRSPDNSANLSREILVSIADLKHEISNHEAELRMYEERFKTQEERLDSLEKQLEEAHQAIKEKVKTLSADSQTSNNENKRRIAELEKKLETQNKNLENMQAALQALTLALQPGEEAQTATAIYEVKPGDSLEKIARKNKTTLKKLKELNQQLKSDQIIVGQKLQIPGE